MAGMTRTHFTQIAARLRMLRPPMCAGQYEAAKYEQWAATVREFADLCSIMNPSFDRLRFYKACGY